MFKLQNQSFLKEILVILLQGEIFSLNENYLVYQFLDNIKRSCSRSSNF